VTKRLQNGGNGKPVKRRLNSLRRKRLESSSKPRPKRNERDDDLSCNRRKKRRSKRGKLNIFMSKKKIFINNSNR